MIAQRLRRWWLGVAVGVVILGGLAWWFTRAPEPPPQPPLQPRVDRPPGLERGGAKPVKPTFPSLWEHYFYSCGVNCHSPVAADFTEFGPDLSTRASFYSGLVGRRIGPDYPQWADFRTGDCNQIPLIDPGSPERSLVAASLIEALATQLEQQVGCTTAYTTHEVNRITITDPELAKALRTWIRQGAPRD